MACAMTLKRSLEFDPIHPTDRCAKRRRLMHTTLSTAAPPTKQHQMTPSPFLLVTPKLTNEEIADQIRFHMKRHHRRHLHFSASNSNQSMVTNSDSSVSASSSCSSSVGADDSLRKPDVPLFTMKELKLLCERAMKEKENEIREEYEKALSNRLIEQYESFLKFNDDQLYRRAGECAASYVS
jgi:hypothetical protein